VASGRELIQRSRRDGGLVIMAGTALGAVVVFVFLALILPAPAGTPSRNAILFNIPFFVGYLVLTLPIGWKVGTAWQERTLAWLADERAPTADEQRATLRFPFNQLLLPAVGWIGAAVVFGLLNLRYSGELGSRVATTILMGGLTTCGFVYLLGERVFRDVAARALHVGPPLRPVAPGVLARSVITWLLATAVPVGGIIFIAAGVINGDTPNNDATAWSIIFLGVAMILVGIVMTIVAARSISEPIQDVREGLARVERGEIDVDVAVYDASEVGLLQAGFNQMAAGLREREQLRDLFGRHVGPDVARRALESGIALGGERRTAAILFVDIAGSTRLVHETEPERVVDMLNRFFGEVVEVVERHSGWVNKFEGDAALCVFGVPESDDACATRALAAARDLAERLSKDDLPRAGIGVSAGEVVAGNIGAAHRLEYTVIGDPVNEAARLTELAKDEDRGVLASESAVGAAGPDEARNWELGDTVELRGRAQPTRLARPRD
jgi:adenylate cyclase